MALSFKFNVPFTCHTETEILVYVALICISKFGDHFSVNLLQVGELCFSYSVAHERDSGVEKWSSEDDMEPYRTVIIFPADKLPTVVDRIKQELATSGT